MCRYAFKNYKHTYACFNCRKVFKQVPDSDLVRPVEPRIEKCPQCGSMMADMGRDFKAPAQSAVKKWKLIESLYTLGHAFSTCGCYGPGFVPRNKQEYAEYLQQHMKTYTNTVRSAIEKGSSKEEIDYWKDRVELAQRDLKKIAG